MLKGFCVPDSKDKNNSQKPWKSQVGQAHTSKYGTLDLNKKGKLYKKRKISNFMLSVHEEANSDAIRSLEVQFHGQGGGDNVSL
jgi:hypothetical protein